MKIVGKELLIQRLDSLFRRAARAWIDGNNGIGFDGQKVKAADKVANNEQHEKECARFQSEAEKLLAELKVEVYYPDLYPVFKFQGQEYHNLESLMAVVAKDGE